MQYFLSKDFEKQFKKLSSKIKAKAIIRLTLFVDNPMDYQLDNHLLSGEWGGYRSISITGDVRAVYKVEGKDVAKFVAIGSHSQLYE